MTNVVGLISDAEVLLGRGSAGRARSLLILAREELARANAVYDTAQQNWSDGHGTSEFPAQHLSFSTKHPDKIEATDDYSRALGPFWGDYDNIAPLKSPAQIQQLNKDKQEGFYVDSAPGPGGRFGSPHDVDPGPVTAELQTVAQLAEMALISDHSRMKFGNQTYDSTHDLQNDLLPIAHPEEFAEFLDSIDQKTDN
ncbi:AbiV family abortive infection protein [Nocardia sp. CA2R105]|nr:AbiV family abortive infection protein [Nocardia coffeae]